MFADSVRQHEHDYRMPNHRSRAAAPRVERQRNGGSYRCECAKREAANRARTAPTEQSPATSPNLRCRSRTFPSAVISRVSTKKKGQLKMKTPNSEQSEIRPRPDLICRGKRQLYITITVEPTNQQIGEIRYLYNIGDLSFEVMTETFDARSVQIKEIREEFPWGKPSVFKGQSPF